MEYEITICSSGLRWLQQFDGSVMDRKFKVQRPRPCQRCWMCGSQFGKNYAFKVFLVLFFDFFAKCFVIQAINEPSKNEEITVIQLQDMTITQDSDKKESLIKFPNKVHVNWRPLAHRVLYDIGSLFRQLWMNSMLRLVCCFLHLCLYFVYV